MNVLIKIAQSFRNLIGGKTGLTPFNRYVLKHISEIRDHSIFESQIIHSLKNEGVDKKSIRSALEELIENGFLTRGLSAWIHLMWIYELTEKAKNELSRSSITNSWLLFFSKKTRRLNILLNC